MTEYKKLTQQIKELKKQRTKVFEKELSELLDKKDKFHYIVDSKEFDNYIISRHSDIWDEFLDGAYYSRHEEIYIDKFRSEHIPNMAFDTLEDQNEVLEFLKMEPITEDEYEELCSETYVRRASLKDFYVFVDDVIRAKVSRFIFDW